MRKWKCIQNPEIFQGSLNKKSYFEGWYYKFVSQDESAAFAVIPGVSLVDSEDRHAFIQVLNGVTGESYYYEFPLSSFKYDQNKLDISIDQNHFSILEVRLDLPVIKGTMKLSDHHLFPKTVRSPGVMGWYSYMPFMECYHGIVSMYHRINGSIVLDDKATNFINGIGYIEKDWGRSFPKSWIWMHSNHFDGQEVSIMASVAHIPWMRNYFIGFLVALEIESKIYMFATYTGAKMKASISDGVVYLEFKKGSRLLKINAKPGIAGNLRSPISGKMRGKVNESLQAEIQIQLTEKGKNIYSGKGSSAGLEVAGETDILLTRDWR